MHHQRSRKQLKDEHQGFNSDGQSDTSSTSSVDDYSTSQADQCKLMKRKYKSSENKNQEATDLQAQLVFLRICSGKSL